MKRRLLLSGLIGLAATPFAPRAAEVSAKSASRRLHLQDCRIAGSHYYDCYAMLELEVASLLMRACLSLLIYRNTDCAAS